MATAGLNLLFTKLRAEGFLVGAMEELRARHVVTLVSESQEDCDLRAALGSVVVKSQNELARFRDVFDGWAALYAPAPVPPVCVTDDEHRLPGPAPKPAMPHRKPHRRRKAWIVGAVVVAVSIAVVVLSSIVSKRSSTESQPEPSAVPGLSDSARIAETKRLPPSALLTLHALGALAAVAIIWRIYGRKSWLPDPERPATRPGLPFVLPLPPHSAGVEPPLRLLRRADEEALVWGIGQFISEERTRQLDMAATVRATARAAGRPEPQYRAARHQREVWLWIDDSVGAIVAGSGRSLERFANEITRSLVEAGLGVERAWFHGIPDELWSDQGRFEPLEVEERRNEALVAVFTDGRALSRRLSSEAEHSRLEALLRTLSGFPKLAFVDFSRGAYALEAELVRRELSVIQPEELAVFLGGTRYLKKAIHISCQLHGDFKAWAAALALAPFPVDEETAFELHAALSLETSPWAIDELRAMSPGPGGRFAWGPDKLAERGALLRWLVAASAPYGARPPGLLGKALQFWKERIREEHARRMTREPAEPWTGTPAEQRMRLDRALLDLWDDPEPGLHQLYRLHGSRNAPGPLPETVAGALRIFGPAECQHPEAVPLPWKRDELSAEAQVMLIEMQFGGNHCPPAWLKSLRRPGRFYMALGGAMALFVLAAVAAGLHMVQQPPDKPPLPSSSRIERADRGSVR